MEHNRRLSVLENTADLLTEDFEYYGNIFKHYISENRDASGNIISDEEEEKLVAALRKKLYGMDKMELVEVIERLAMYEQFGGSEELMKFIDLSRRFVIAIEKDKYKLYNFLPYWEKDINLDVKSSSFENMERVMICDAVYRYLKKVLSTL